MNHNYLTAFNKIIKDFHCQEIFFLMVLLTDPDNPHPKKQMSEVDAYLDASLIHFEMIEIQDKYYQFIIKHYDFIKVYRPKDITALKEYIRTKEGFVYFTSFIRSVLECRDILKASLEVAI